MLSCWRASNQMISAWLCKPTPDRARISPRRYNPATGCINRSALGAPEPADYTVNQTGLPSINTNAEKSRQTIGFGGRDLVRKERLELSRVAPQEPKSSASTNSATFASRDIPECGDYTRFQQPASTGKCGRPEYLPDQIQHLLTQAVMAQ